VDLDNRILKLLDVPEHKNRSLTTDVDRDQDENTRASLTIFSNSDGSEKAKRHVKPSSMDMVVTTTCDNHLGLHSNNRNEQECLVRTTEEIG
jgi:hypothetical protein